MGPKFKPNEAKRIRKRKKTEGNVSDEKPNKKSNSAHQTHSTKPHVNKPEKINTQTNEMSSPNPAMLDSTIPQQQYIPQFQQFQQLPVPPRKPPPNYHQSPTSPCVGFYTSTPHSLIPPMQQNHFQTDARDTDTKLDNLSMKLNEICDKLSAIDSLTEKLTSFDKTVKNLTTTVENVTKREDDIEKGIINETFEYSKSEVREVKSLLTEIKADNFEMCKNMGQLKTDLQELHNRHIDLQTRSMRENLIFTGIPMPNKYESSDDTEKVLDDFMFRQLKMDEIGAYHRAHRFGKEYEVKDRSGNVKYTTKSIVCRFQNFKERERVRKSAKELKGTVYGISEQFPKEVNDKRKELWPQFQEARRQNKKAHFKRDRLYVDGTEVFPSVKHNRMRMETNDINGDNLRQRYEGQGARPKTRDSGRPRRDPLHQSY